MFTPHKKHTTNQTPEQSSCCRNFTLSRSSIFYYSSTDLITAEYQSPILQLLSWPHIFRKHFSMQASVHLETILSYNQVTVALL